VVPPIGKPHVGSVEQATRGDIRNGDIGRLMQDSSGRDVVADPIGALVAGESLSWRWLVHDAWPLWLEHGVDWRRRAFHEYLDLATLQCGAGYRRLRVAARQTYVFSKAAAFGIPGAGDAAALGLEFLRGPARQVDGGYASRFGLDNRPIDSMRDLYDHAFVLLAFAGAAAVVGADAVRRDAVALVEYVSTNFRHPEGGYEESLPPALPRRQNPHMHLFEALLAANEAFGDELFFVRARGLADVFQDRLFQPKEGALPEFFDSKLTPIREGGRFAVEPGHLYEWIWLLDWYARRASSLGERVRPDLAAASDALLGFADGNARSPDCGLVVNLTWSDGAVQDGAFRLWPQTERLKAAARHRARASEDFAAARQALAKHMTGVRPGLWIERMDARGQNTGDPAPSTSLYHLTTALTDDAVMALT
jgi:mannose/cellobiose epimerase-like protein (N-acyl-D-glucosamine 2-epimerase family)